MDVITGEGSNVDFAEFTNAFDIVLVDQHPVDARLKSSGDASLAVLPVANFVVCFEPDGACHVDMLVGGGLERGASSLSVDSSGVALFCDRVANDSARTAIAAMDRKLIDIVE
jgi:hypothetical protein